MTEETKLLLEMSSEVKTLVKTTASLSQKMDELQKEFVTTITSRMAVQEEKTARLERVVYGLIAMVAAQSMAIIFNFIK